MGPSPVEVTLFVTDRFVMTPTGPDGGGAHVLEVVDTLPGFIVDSPFYLEARSELEEVSVRHANTEVFGVGDHLSEALDDFRHAIVDLYVRLEAERDSLPPAMRTTLDLLDSKIHRA